MRVLKIIYRRCPIVFSTAQHLVILHHRQPGLSAEHQSSDRQLIKPCSLGSRRRSHNKGHHHMLIQSQIRLCLGRMGRCHSAESMLLASLASSGSRQSQLHMRFLSWTSSADRTDKLDPEDCKSSLLSALSLHRVWRENCFIRSAGEKDILGGKAARGKDV